MSSAAHDNHGAGHGSLGSYAIGFVLSVILTAIPFYMVMDGGFRATRPSSPWSSSAWCKWWCT